METLLAYRIDKKSMLVNIIKFCCIYISTTPLLILLGQNIVDRIR